MCAISTGTEKKDVGRRQKSGPSDQRPLADDLGGGKCKKKWSRRAETAYDTMSHLTKNAGALGQQ
jgi:hypothetical protein